MRFRNENKMADNNKSEDETNEPQSETGEIPASEVIPPEIASELPREMRQMIGVFAGRTQNPIAEKVTPEHISQLLSHSEADAKRTHESAKHARWERVLYAALIAAIFVFLLIFLGERDLDLLIDILSYLGTAVVSFLGGLGWRNWGQGKEV
jgi:hypothetical protein